MDVQCSIFLLLSIQGHTQAVWAVISIGDVEKNANFVLTGAADNLIIAWKDNIKLQTYEGKQFFLINH